jgi:hypothetical protein
MSRTGNISNQRRRKSMGLEMKYFVLKPRSKSVGDKWAKASREAIRTFAREIADIDPDLADSLCRWADEEMTRELDLASFPNPKYVRSKRGRPRSDNPSSSTVYMRGYNAGRRSSRAGIAL